MDWDRYKQLCDQPNVVSRWMLEQTLELVASDRVAGVLREALNQMPLRKPPDHLAGEATSMYVLALSVLQLERIVRLVRAARDARRVTSQTTRRGLGGFVEAWGEYLKWQQETSMSNDNAVVLELIDAFNNMDLDRVVACFAEGAIYHNMPMEPVTGPDAIRGVLQGFMASSSAVQWDLLNIVGADGVVLTERVDKFKVNDVWIELPVMGTFEVSDGKITAWRDYFDLGQFQAQMAAAASG